MMAKIKLWTGGGFLLLLAIFILQNLKRVYVDFLFWEFHFSRAFLIIFMLLLGFLSGILFPHFMKAFKKIGNPGKTNKEVEQEAAPSQEKS